MGWVLAWFCTSQPGRCLLGPLCHQGDTSWVDSHSKPRLRMCVLHSGSCTGNFSPVVLLWAGAEDPNSMF